MIKRLIWVCFVIVLVACTNEQAPKEGVKIRLMTHDSFAISEETILAFTEESGIEVEIFKAGDGGSMLNQAILAKDAPLADLIFGIDNSFLSRALEADILIPYQSKMIDQLDPSLLLDKENRLLPVDYGDVCLNYDKAWFAEKGLTPPTNLEDLIKVAYKDLTVVENPATSTPGLAFLLTTIGHFGEEGGFEYWGKLVENGVLVTNGWEEAYWGAFTAASDGDRPIVVSYASSPPAEVYYAEVAMAEAPTAAVVTAGSCFRQIEFVGILKGTPHVAEAEMLVDFMLGKQFQEDIPLNMFVYPANKSATLPDLFVTHSERVIDPILLDAAQIQMHREEWIEMWQEIVLR